MSKFYALKKDVFDINKVTVVGNPTITSDGVASGFDSANANNVQIPTAIISQIATANTWKVEVSGTVQESGFTYGNIRTDNNIRYDLIQINRYTNGFMFVCCLDENGTTTSKNIPITFSNTYNGKAYKATLEFTGTKYIATVQFGDGNVLTNSLDSSYKIKFFNYGDKFELGYKCINGSINLKDFKIYVDNQLVFQPVKPAYLLERRKEGYDSSKFTIVGNPTITSNGVVSGFSGSNYIRVPYRALGQNFKIFTPKFNSSNVSQQQKIVRYSDGNIRIEIYQNKIRLYRYSGNNVYDLPTGKTTLQNNIDYYYYVEQTTDGTNYYLKGYISTDNKNWSLDIDKTYTSAMYDYKNNAPIQISGADANQPFIGTLDLPSTSITTDGKEVFTGAKEVYYAMEK